MSATTRNEREDQAKLNIGRSKTRWLLTGLGMVAVSGLLLVLGSGCGQEKAEAKPEEVMQVAVTHPKLETFRRYINQPGVVESYETTPIYTKLAGFLEDVRVDIGDQIKKNELLCKVWVPEVEEAVAVKNAKITQGKAEVKRAEETLVAALANVKTSTENVDVAKASVIRAEALKKRWEDEYVRDTGPLSSVLPPKTIMETKHQLDASVSAVKQTNANVGAAAAALIESKAKAEQASVDVDVSKANLAVWIAEYQEELAWFGYANITAPYDGIVTRRYIHTGHFVQPVNSGTTSKAAEPLFVVMRTDKMRMVVQVPEYDAPLVKDGADAIVRLQAYPGEDIKCKVTQSSWSLDSEVRTLRVEIFITNPCPQLRSGELVQAGMYANVSIAADVPNVLTLPASAILTDGNQRYCYMLEDGKARRVNVHIGTTNEKVTEVMTKQSPPEKLGDEGRWVPFSGNEQVIISKLKSIQDGQPVKAQ